MLSEKITRLQKLINEIEPSVLALVPEEGRFERLKTEAAALERTFPDAKNRPPLWGTLLGVKDIFRVDGFPTQAGSQLPSNQLAGPEAISVSLLKKNGALVVGKTVTTEFAYFGPGPTRNPHNPEHTPGGSSSGSAAAVAAGLCELALGTQTIGSVNRPAAFCGIVGYKPSYDRISRAGVIPLAGSLDHIGLFAPNVSSAEIAAAILAAPWRHAPDSRPVLGVPKGPYLTRLEAVGRSLFEENIRQLAASGFEIREVEALEDFDQIYDRHQLILAAEAARVHENWFARYGERYHPKTRELIEKGQSISDEVLAAAISEIPAYRNRMADLMKAHTIDAWVTPSAPGPAPHGLESTGDPVMNLPWTQAGLPTLTIPSGSAENGLPVGLQLIAGWYEDERLFSWGKQVESAILPYNS